VSQYNRKKNCKDQPDIMATTTSTTSGTSSTNFIGMLGAGSGVDTKALATNLTNAEMQPRKDVINASIAKCEARISGYAGMMNALSYVKDAFAKLQNNAQFGTVSVQNSNTTAFSLSASSSALTGSHDIEVLALAQSQRNQSSAFAASTTSINSGDAFDLNIAIGGGDATTVRVSTATPAGVVSAINKANLGVKAQLVSTGDSSNPYRIAVSSSSSGTANSFTITASDDQGDPLPDLDFSTVLRSAADASVRVDGMTLTRSSNVISDAISGTTLNLYSTTSTAASVQLTQDLSSVKTNIQALVTTYNDFQSIVRELTDKNSTVPNLGGSLANETLVRTIQSQVRNMFIGSSSTPGTTVKALRDVGISINSNGNLDLNQTKLDDAIINRPDEVALMLNANVSNQDQAFRSTRGLAGDAVKKLTAMLSSTGPIASAKQSTITAENRYKDMLLRLEAQTAATLARYTKQFAAMDNIVGQANSQKTSLKNTFDAMSRNNNS
jgi:flagellar hook-associated protein 2